mmetsp:Transcript_6221/g.19184  ORF Transcript_6221/g.19184 Transcript_6221/m.19184 type:complete len:248 (-) Transcript_6221:99-842(-)
MLSHQRLDAPARRERVLDPAVAVADEHAHVHVERVVEALERLGHVAKLEVLRQLPGRVHRARPARREGAVRDVVPWNLADGPAVFCHAARARRVVDEQVAVPPRPDARAALRRLDLVVPRELVPIVREIIRKERDRRRRVAVAAREGCFGRAVDAAAASRRPERRRRLSRRERGGPDATEDRSQSRGERELHQPSRTPHNFKTRGLARPASARQDYCVAYSSLACLCARQRARSVGQRAQGCKTCLP